MDLKLFGLIAALCGAHEASRTTVLVVSRGAQGEDLVAGRTTGPASSPVPIYREVTEKSKRKRPMDAGECDLESTLLLQKHLNVLF